MKYIVALVFSLLAWGRAEAQQTAASSERVSKTLPVPAKDPWDMDLHTGGAFGDFINKEGVVKAFGGFLAGFAVYFDSLIEGQSTFLSFDAVVDPTNQQVVRKGASAGSSYFLLGGKKREIQRLKTGSVVTQNRYSLAWTNRVAYDAFSVTPVELGVEKLEGSNVSILTGFTFNWIITRNGSLIIGASQTLASFSASVEKSRQKATEVSLGWRSYL